MSRRVLLFLLLSAAPLLGRAASLSLGPTAGTFTTGSTFDVSVLLDTGGQTVNAVGATLQFPPDKLQLVSPTVGRSVIGVWVTAPQFNNQTGQVNLEGVIPGGLRTNNGLLTTLTFRVKSVGQTVVKFLSQSKVLLNDGVGTDVLDKIQNGIYQLVLPPPAGPLVTSETHPDQAKWYPNSNAVLTWAAGEDSVQGYSYVLSNEPIDVPDEISEGLRNGVSYRGLNEGRHYFHIKALRGGVWGETTHFAVLVDETPPADFPVTILPSGRTTSRRPVIQFATTDNSSGLDHYELKVVPLSSPAGSETGTQPLFIETGSPYVPGELSLGDYDVMVRAYDVAGNYRKVTKRLAIVTLPLRFVSDEGLILNDRLSLSWPWLILLISAGLAGLIYWARRLRFIHFHLHRASDQAPLPESVRGRLDELQKYRERYGKALVLALALGLSCWWPLAPARAAAPEAPRPPVVTSFSRHISNQEIFYLGGETADPNSEVLIYLQNPLTGELTSARVLADNDGRWFYRHDAFLPAGSYQVWTQARRGQELSPPGPQLALAVESRAFQLGASRLSYEAIYLFVILILLIVLAFVIADIVIHHRRIREKRQLVDERVRAAEESVRRGFALLRRDIEAELALIRRAKLRRELAAAERATETKLLHDLRVVERYIGEEVWSLEKVEYNKS